MVDETDHGGCVDAWLERAAKGVPAERLIPVFARGFAALWQRAHQPLGEITLSAIVERVLVTAAERFPPLAALKLEAAGLRCQELQELQAQAGSLHPDQLAKGLRFVLVEFLTVLGNLTAEILTPALHAELAKVAPEAREDGEGATS
jgi:hypothetical protein